MKMCFLAKWNFLIVVSSFIHCYDSFQLTTNPTNATIQRDVSLTCTTDEPYIQFRMLPNTPVCLITGSYTNGSCILSGSYIENYIYTCDTENEYTVTIPGNFVTEQLHSTKWLCQNPFEGDVKPAETTLYINIPISSIQISAIPVDNNPVEINNGSTQKFICTTDVGRPSSHIQWYLSDTNFTVKATAQADNCNTDCKDGKVISSSVLDYIGNEKDEGKQFFCTAVNTNEMDVVRSQNRSLIIRYAFQLTTNPTNATIQRDVSLTCTTNEPKIHFRMVKTAVCLITGSYTNGSCILSGSYIEDYIYTCDTENKYTVTIPGNFVTEQLHNTTWSCQNPFNGNIAPAVIQLYVNIPITSINISTSLTTSSKIELLNGTTVLFTCTTNAGRPSSRIQWYLSNENLTSNATVQPDVCYSECNETVVSSSVLNYTGKINDDGKNIYCSAVNIDGLEPVRSQNKTVIIIYGPLEARISPSIKSYAINETDGIGPITCTADCKPACSVTWSGPNLPIGTTNVLYVQNIEKNQAGNYHCTAKNDVGSVTSDQIEVVINYGPRVVYISPLMQEYTVNEFGNVGPINCTTECKPSCTITWLGPNLPVGTASVLNIHKINRNQTGNYYCTAENLIKRTSSVIVRVDVYYGVMMFPMEKRHVTEGNELNITCTGQSYPPITDDDVTWTKHENATFRKSERNLFIQHANKLDSGFYLCSVFKTLSPIIGQPVNLSGTAFVEVDVDIQCQCEEDISTKKDDTTLIFNAGIVSLVVGIILILLTAVWNIFFRNRFAKETENSRSNKYAQMTSNNPAFTDSYDTVDQGNPVDTGTRTDQQTQSSDKNTYEEIEQHSKTDEHVYKDLKDRDDDGKNRSEYANTK